MNGEVIFLAIMVFLVIMVASYVVTSLGLYFYLKKMEDSNKWGAFVPVYNNYKYFKIAYDGIKIDGVDSGTDIEAYKERRKSKALLYFFIYIGLAFVVGLIVGIYDASTAPDTLEYGVNVGLDTTGSIIVDIVGTLLSIALVAFMTYGVSKSVYNKETKVGLSNGISYLNVLLSVVTLGLYTIVLTYYFGLSSKYGYKLDGNYINFGNDEGEIIPEEELGDRFNLTNEEGMEEK